MLTHEREAAAVSAGLDIFTYNMIMDLQHRDITPEDYETLRRLDSSVQPKTISLEKLECACPRWTVPATRSATSQGASKELCCICLEHFACGDQLRRLPCRHTFHSNCIVRRPRLPLPGLQSRKYEKRVSERTHNNTDSCTPSDPFDPFRH